MSGRRPRIAIGTYGAVHVMRNGDRHDAETRFRDLDGRLRGYGSGAVLTLASPFGDLVALWLADLELRELARGTKESYRDQVRLHVLPAIEHFTLGEITTGRVEWFVKSEAAVSHSRAKQSRTMLNLLFGFALRHDAISRNPVEGTSSLRKPKTGRKLSRWSRSRPSEWPRPTGAPTLAGSSCAVARAHALDRARGAAFATGVRTESGRLGREEHRHLGP